MIIFLGKLLRKLNINYPNRNMASILIRCKLSTLNNPNKHRRDFLWRRKRFCNPEREREREIELNWEKEREREWSLVIDLIIIIIYIT